MRDFGLRKTRPREMPNTAASWRFFKTVQGPDATAYPEAADNPTVYYARMLSGVSFTETVGAQSLTYTETDTYKYLFNLASEDYIEENSVVLCFPSGGKWYTIDKVKEGSSYYVSAQSPTLNGLFRRSKFTGAQLANTSGEYPFAIDSQNSFYQFEHSGPKTAIEKLDFNGNVDWSYAPSDLFRETWGTPAKRVTPVVDDGFNIYAPTYSTVDNSPLASQVVASLDKINSSGSNVWTYSKSPPALSGSLGSDYTVHDVSVDADGNCHITGIRDYVNKSTITAITLGRFEASIDSSGAERWVDISSNTAPASDEAYGKQCFFDASGNVICVYENLGTTDDITLKSYDDSGSELFSHTSSSFPNVDFAAYSNGKLYCLRRTSTQFLIARYSGSEYLTNDWACNLGIDATAFGLGAYPLLRVDGDGNVFAVFLATPIAGGNPTAHYVKVDSSGALDFDVTLTESSHNFFGLMVPPGRPIQFIN